MSINQIHSDRMDAGPVIAVNMPHSQMKYYLQSIVFASSLLWPFDASAGAPLPLEVQAYLDKRDTCDHFRGEHGGTKER